MSFTVGSLSTSSTLTFGPSRVDITWDGKSNGKVSVLPVCTDTATTATYSVGILRVFPAAEDKVVYSYGNTITYSAMAGEAYLLEDDPLSTSMANAYRYTEFTVGSTLATNTGVVAFELIPSNTNYTNRTDISTLSPHYFTWKMTQNRGTASQVVAVGKLTMLAPNPYSASNAVGNLVEAKTAHFCIG